MIGSARAAGAAARATSTTRATIQARKGDRPYRSTFTPMATPPLRWDGTRLHVLDQTALPFAEEVLVLEDADAVADAIGRLAVRGAPLIGIAAGYGVAMAAAAGADVDRAAAGLGDARPTAANLAIATAGADLLRGASTVLTHCNTGALAAGGRGTALAVILALDDVHVL